MPYIGPSSNPRRHHSVDSDLSDDGELRFGKETEEGTWKVMRDGDNLIISRRESGSFIEKMEVIAE